MHRKYHLPTKEAMHKINTFRKSHADILKVIFSQTTVKYAASTSYGILTVLLFTLKGEWFSGLIMGLFNFIGAIIIRPIAGNFIDEYGSKPIMIFSAICLLLGGLTLLFFPLNMLTLLIFATLLFTYYGTIASDTYLYRVCKKEEGGLISGITENVYAISYLLASLSLPILIIQENTIITGGILVFCAVINVFGTVTIKNDTRYLCHESYTERKKNRIKDLNPIYCIKRSIHYIKKNQKFPLLSVGASIFQGIFYSTIWFVIPLVMLKTAGETNKIIEGLQLGIYEIITISFAGLIGYLADKGSWKKIHIYGWILIILGTMLMPILNSPIGLIIVGIFVGFGNNFSYFASIHTLRMVDTDSGEAGSFLSFTIMIQDLGYTFAPIICSLLYALWGVSAGFLFVTISCFLVGIWMIKLTLELPPKLASKEALIKWANKKKI